MCVARFLLFFGLNGQFAMCVCLLGWWWSSCDDDARRRRHSDDDKKKAIRKKIINEEVINAIAQHSTRPANVFIKKIVCLFQFIRVQFLFLLLLFAVHFAVLSVLLSISNASLFSAAQTCRAIITTIFFFRAVVVVAVLSRRADRTFRILVGYRCVYKYAAMCSREIDWERCLFVRPEQIFTILDFILDWMETKYVFALFVPYIATPHSFVRDFVFFSLLHCSGRWFYTSSLVCLCTLLPYTRFDTIYFAMIACRFSQPVFLSRSCATLRSSSRFSHNGKVMSCASCITNWNHKLFKLMSFLMSTMYVYIYYCLTAALQFVLCGFA